MYPPGSGGGANCLSKTGNGSAVDLSDKDDGGLLKPQPWYFHVVASVILVVHGFTFLIPHDTESEDTDMVRTVAGWLDYDMSWVKPLTPYAQVKDILFFLKGERR